MRGKRIERRQGRDIWVRRRSSVGDKKELGFCFAFVFFFKCCRAVEGKGRVQGGGQRGNVDDSEEEQERGLI